MKKLMTFAALVSVMLTGCNTQTGEIMNPFFSEYDTPFEVPPFDIIENEHFIPAAKAGFSEQLAEIKAIVDNAEVSTFENTIEAFVLSGELLRKVEGVFDKLLEAETNNEIDSIARILVPMKAAHNSSIMLDPGLFNRVKSVSDNQESMDLNPEQTMVLKKIYKHFIRGGANLNDQEKLRISEIDERLSTLSLEFGNDILAETNNYQMILESEGDLAGLPESVRSAAADAASAAGLEGKWVFTLHKPSWIPFLQYSACRELREKIYKAMYMRSNQGNEYDNNKMILEILELRLERARLLGYETHADFVLEERMAKEPANVYELLMKVWEPALDKAKVEAAMMQEMIDNEGGDFQLASWDWWYYAEKIRKEKYALDEEEVRAYFSLETVINGLFDVVNKLYGLTFEPRNDLPVYHKEVMPYEVKEADGSHLGILYMDFHPRPGKQSGAWSTDIRTAHVKDGEQITPVNMIVMNFTRPTGDKPALLSFDETLTFFHEFGHALHGLFKQSKYLGTNVATDFVELPSQIMENWAAHPEVLKTYAKHYKTGDPIPNELIAKMDAASKFNQGFVTVEYTAASLLDMDYHTLTDLAGIDPNAFEQASMEKIGLISEIIPRYKSNYFQHIFSWGYSSGYYSYMWSEVLDKDAFNAFLETSLFDQATATSFRKNILERGGSEEEMKMYVNFRGKEPTIEPLLTGRGLN
ncbi:MAG: M3 family peptidase [Bacteroidia bacterium]|nr:MAG: M3 family peptidase [Bacteroidia bacterium]